MSDLTSLFTPVSVQDDPPRLAVSLDGLEKRGKTHWAIMTSPEPVAVISNDTGTENIVRMAMKKGRKIYGNGIMDVGFESPDPMVIAASNVDKAEHETWIKSWKKYKDGINRIIDDKTIRTVVKDTETGIYELAQLAVFGKLRSNARKDLWAELNAEYTKVFWDLYKGRPDINILLIHKNKKQYAANSKGEEVWNKKYERAGHKDVGFQVDLSLKFEWDSVMKDFYTEIDTNQPLRYMENRDKLIGQKWFAGDENDPSHFAILAMTVFPETELDPEYWGWK